MIGLVRGLHSSGGSVPQHLTKFTYSPVSETEFPLGSSWLPSRHQDFSHL